MAVWKQILVSGSNVSTLLNDTGYAVTASNIFNGNQTITGSLFITGSSTFTGPLFKFTGDVEITGTLKVNTNGTNTQPSMQIDSNGLFIIGEFSSTPSATAGAIMLSGSDFYIAT